MPRAIVKGKLVRVPYNHKLPKPKNKITKMSNSALSQPSEEDWKYQPVLLDGEKLISCRRTRVAKKQGKETYEIDETPYGKINVINDDLTWRINPLRGAHHSGRLFLTTKRLVHVIKQGWDRWAKYTVDFDRPLSTLQTAAVETGDGWKRKMYYPGKRLTVQYYKGDVEMFGDTILAQRGGTPIDEQKEASKERELRKKRERLEFELEKLKSGESKADQNKLKQKIESELEKLKRKEIELEKRSPEITLEKRKLKERGLLAVAGRREAFLERSPEKRRFHIAHGEVDEFLREIKKRAGIE
jgi:hypothetical protein